MVSLLQKLVATFAAVAVFVTSFHCVCQGAMMADADRACQQKLGSTTACHSCCDHDDDDHDADQGAAPCKHDGSSPHSPTCNHCNASLVSEGSAAISFHPADLSQIAAVSDLLSFDTLADLRVTYRHFAADQPPPRFAHTLLSLHCALTI